MPENCQNLQNPQTKGPATLELVRSLQNVRNSEPLICSFMPMPVLLRTRNHWNTSVQVLGIRGGSAELVLVFCGSCEGSLYDSSGSDKAGVGVVLVVVLGGGSILVQGYF